MRIAIAQLNPIVGAFSLNAKMIAEAYQKAVDQNCRVLFTSELCLNGYPPHDLIERPEIFERTESALNELKALTQGKNCALAIGHIGRNHSNLGRPAFNQVSIFEKGKLVFNQSKTLLPTYDVFDEARYFEPASEIQLWKCDDQKIGIAICEDLWGGFSFLGKKIYAKDPIQTFEDQGADFIVSISSSPYEWGKQKSREQLHKEIALRLKVPLIYVNQVGANDEILFDGGSFAWDGKGNFLGRLPLFQSSFGVLDVQKIGESSFQYPASKNREDQNPEEIEVLTRGLVLGIQDYFQKSGFQMAVIGLSGGIDSAVVATLAAKALGAKKVLGVAMPSQYSSSHSLEDAEILAKNLGIPFEVRPIKFMYSTLSRELSESRGTLSPIALENLQARLRGIILMTLSNHYSALVLTTGNKSELAMGYCTLYGDMAGALDPIGDLFKTRVYELARYLNLSWNSPIPERTLTKAPSAELRPNQKDQDSLPPYEVLDQILSAYLEEGKSLSEITSQVQFAEESKNHSVFDILRKVELNEFKRRQAAPVLKASRKAFGIGRRIPIVKHWS